MIVRTQSDVRQRTDALVRGSHRRRVRIVPSLANGAYFMKTHSPARPVCAAASASAFGAAPARTAPAAHALWITAAALLLSACASAPPPREQMAVAEAAVANATSAGAQQWAPAELRLAQDKLMRAQSAAAAADNERALTLAREADADARVATAAAGANRAQKAADEVQEASRVLREEMSRREPGRRLP